MACFLLRDARFAVKGNEAVLCTLYVQAADIFFFLLSGADGADLVLEAVGLASHGQRDHYLHGFTPGFWLQ